MVGGEFQVCHITIGQCHDKQAHFIPYLWPEMSIRFPLIIYSWWYSTLYSARQGISISVGYTQVVVGDVNQILHAENGSELLSTIIKDYEEKC